MSNKFTKSVLERQAKESKQQSAGLPASKEQPAEKRPSPEKPQAEKTAAQPPSLNMVQEPAPLNLDAFLIKETVRSAKNKTFYLDTAVISAIHKAAKARNINDSKLVNDILKKILQVD